MKASFYTAYLFCFGGFKHIYIVMYTWANVKFLLPWRIIVFVVNIDRKYVILSELGPAEHKRRGLPPRSLFDPESEQQVPVVITKLHR